MVEKHAPNSFAELYKKSICRLLLIELGPRVIKKPYAFLDMGWREKNHCLTRTTTPQNQTTRWFLVFLADWRMNLCRWSIEAGKNRITEYHPKLWYHLPNQISCYTNLPILKWNLNNSAFCRPQVVKSACILLSKERHSKGERVPFSAWHKL